eukprot:353033-Chlamydomonas_euryale.AAC.7
MRPLQGHADAQSTPMHEPHACPWPIPMQLSHACQLTFSVQPTRAPLTRVTGAGPRCYRPYTRRRHGLDLRPVVAVAASSAGSEGGGPRRGAARGVGGRTCVFCAAADEPYLFSFPHTPQGVSALRAVRRFLHSTPSAILAE